MDRNASLPVYSIPVDDQKLAVRAICITFPILAIIATFLRLEARRLKGARLWWDDYTALAALILSIGVAVDVLICSMVGNLGGHEEVDSQGDPVNLASYTVFAKTIYTLQLIIWPAVGVTKISVLLLYARIFVEDNLQRAIRISIGIVIACCVAFEFALIFTCTPIAANWDPSLPYHCLDEAALVTAALTTDVLTDALILCLPIRSIWRLQAPRRTKIIVFFMFLLGGLVTVTGIIRLHFLKDAYVALQDPNYNDETFVFTRPIYWSVIESSTGVISACLPTIKPVWKGYRLDRFLPSAFRSISDHSNHTQVTESISSPLSRPRPNFITFESALQTGGFSVSHMESSEDVCRVEMEEHEDSPHDFERNTPKLEHAIDIGLAG